MSQGAVRAVLLTGTIGVGKTALAEALSVVLHEAGIRHALLDLDWLGQVYPAPDADDPFSTGLVAENLALIWPNFLAAGARYAIVAGTVESRQQLDELRRALPGVDITVCLVVASSDLVKERIRDRDRGRLLDDFLARTDGLAQTIEKARMHDLVVRNEDQPPEAIAQETVMKLGWL